MIGYIKGKIEEIGLDYLIIENNNIGYKLNTSANTIANVRKNEDTKIYTKMIVREDDISLCGFYSKDEETMFNLLTSVSKIGTKVGLAMLSFASPSKIRQYIISSDTASLAKAPGVGKKTAERIVLELKDKVSKATFDESIEDRKIENLNTSQNDDEVNGAIDALMALGYSSTEANESVNFVKQPGMSVEDIVKKGLEYIMKTSFKF
ncbi:Holliday junction branch migration protein RuvA [Peptostreptococcus equinus]|uniref:Holliday junction branch migration complex subunit RuvA n=1 Tax=Peptostreptococcus equinus TaxID=3003601 RepID=A0ABY7JQ61_9FIRM|nr:Holliday junction branch migration protein RuvA [Peptostreptococcus sp. CBA3647]WAW15493.1 Holliday junction branch migration protein RuvA [Peptostreptococcus sp. CBA3647]